MTYYRIINKSITSGATSGVGIVYPSGAHSSRQVFSGVPIAQSLVFE